MKLNGAERAGSTYFGDMHDVTGDYSTDWHLDDSTISKCNDGNGSIQCQRLCDVIVLPYAFDRKPDVISEKTTDNEQVSPVSSDNCR